MIDALQFLTVFRVGGSRRPGRAALLFFPLVGLLVGLVWALTGMVVGARFPTAVTAASVLLVDALITGALHLDALADVADGVASRRRGDDAFAVMRDPATGAVGAAFLVIVCLLRFGALTVVIDGGYGLIAAPVAGRAGMVVLMWLLRPRQDGTLATLFRRPGPAVTAGVVVVAAVCALPFGARALVALAVGLGVTGVYSLWWRSRFGALNGDGIGAAGLVAETAALLALAAR